MVFEAPAWIVLLPGIPAVAVARHRSGVHSFPSLGLLQFWTGESSGIEIRGLDWLLGKIENIFQTWHRLPRAVAVSLSLE